MNSNDSFDSANVGNGRNQSSFEIHREREQIRERHRRERRRSNVIRTVLLMLVALAVGVLVGLFALPAVLRPSAGAGTSAGAPSLFAPAVAGRVTIDESELDQPLGSYTYQGTTTTISVREAIEESVSLDAVHNSDGTYDIPGADAVLAIARNRLLLQEAETRGIAASEQDTLAYVREVWQTEDYAVIAASYSMTTDQVKKLMQESATIKKLRDAVATTKPASGPAAPNPPEAGKEDEPMKEYADYIMALMGDEWNAEANTWAREDGPYHEKLINFTISNDGATYSAAQEAYFVAQAQSVAGGQEASTEWTTFVNTILSNVTVELNTLVA